jgi:lysophospholipase L1-like esterase
MKLANCPLFTPTAVIGGVVFGTFLSVPLAFGAPEKTMFKFDFGTGPVAPGYTQVSPATAYTKETGYGFVNAPAVSAADRGGPDALRRDFCTSDRPFYFAVDLPEGNYNVTVSLGDQTGASTTTVKAESRRLMLEKVRTAPGNFEARTFTVNVRRPQLNSGEKVRLKPREQPKLDWDNQLTLEFNGTRPCVCALDITKVDDAVTVYLAGDSTVTDQEYEPWCAWRQMLPRFFKPGVALANHAESGEALKSFLGERRLEKILETIKAGDYLFLQFAHNDQKQGTAHVEPFTTYQEHLKLYIDEARTRKAIPVLVTPMHRRRFDADGRIVNTLGDYPEAMRQTAGEENVALIDLNAMSKVLFEALGPEDSKKAFVHYPAGTFPGQEQALKDDTHFNAYGGYELARCVVEGIKVAGLGIAKSLVDDVSPFDPGRPDPVDNWSLPASPMSTAETPAYPGQPNESGSTPPASSPPAPDPGRPTLFIIGDSTVKNGAKGQVGWGDPIAAYFDPARIKVVNRAIGGRSSRTFLTEGRWDQVLAEMKPGDFLLLQFGHNDGGPITGGRARASLKGIGDETQEVTNAQTGQKEVVHSYGWYLRKYVRDAKARGATPIVLSPIPRNRWSENRTVFRASGDYGRWAAEVAQSEGVAFVDLNEIVARRYEEMGQEKVNALFGGDWTHTNAAGAEINAASVISGLKALKEFPLCRYLSAKAGEISAFTAHAGK